MQFIPYHDCDDNRLVAERMASKAICAYENLVAIKRDGDELVMQYGQEQVNLRCAELESEYQATVRCLDMLVRGSLYEICQEIVARAEKELGVEA